MVAAQGVQKRLTMCDEARSKTLAAQRALTVKMQSKSGVTREELDALDEAMKEARAAGVSEAVAYMVDASILKDRGEKQLEAQTMLTQSLASLSKSKMRGRLWMTISNVKDRLVCSSVSCVSSRELVPCGCLLLNLVGSM